MAPQDSIQDSEMGEIICLLSFVLPGPCNIRALREALGKEGFNFPIPRAGASLPSHQEQNQKGVWALLGKVRGC